MIDGATINHNGTNHAIRNQGGTLDSTSMFCNSEYAITINAGVFKNNATVTDYGFGSIRSKVPATSTATTNADGSITETVN